MSVWLTPDLKPIVGGTYFPPDDRYYGKPGFKTVLQHILTKVIKDFKSFRSHLTITVAFFPPN